MQFSLWFKGECPQWRQTNWGVLSFSVPDMIYDSFQWPRRWLKMPGDICDKPIMWQLKVLINAGINNPFSVISWSAQSSALAATPCLSECPNWTLPLYLFLSCVISFTCDAHFYSLSPNDLCCFDFTNWFPTFVLTSQKYTFLVIVVFLAGWHILFMPTSDS